MKIIEIDPSIRELVKVNDGYCPCAIEHNPDTNCICKDFREQDKPGECHCGRFVKVYGDDMNVHTSGEIGVGE